MKNIIKVFSLFSLIFFLGIFIHLLYNKSSYKKDVEEDKVIYQLLYYDDAIHGSKHDISIIKNKITIDTIHFCSATDCGELDKTTKEMNYSNESIKKLIQFIENNFLDKNKDNKEIVIYEWNLNEREKEIFRGLFLGEYFFETSIEEYKYKLEYSKSNSLTYDVYFKNNGSIIVKKLTINNDYNITNIKTYTLKFSKRHLKILNNYIKKEIQDTNDSNIVYKNSTLKKDEIKIIASIVENNESYLDDIKDDTKLIYTISYSGINCLTPVLYLYDDNTYEYYYTFNTDEAPLIPKTGYYNYDVQKIIDNINGHKEDKYGVYTILDRDGKSYTTNSSNIKLQELIKQLGINFEQCLKQENN